MMDGNNLHSMFNLEGKVAVITGGSGVLGAGISKTLAGLGASVAVLEARKEKAELFVEEITAAGGRAMPVYCDVMKKETIHAAASEVLDAYGKVDILINGAGGNKPQATTDAEQSFFDLPSDAFQYVVDLNFLGTILTCQVFGRAMADARQGVILNVSSMNAFRPLTRVPAYSAAKAAVSNFTLWLAVHMAQEYSPLIRVNAIAPGFFQTEQNRYLLTDQETGELTPRGKSIIVHTPMNRFGTPDDLLGAVLWLISPASSFVTGIVVPIDGGFSAFSGV